jgi:hypothetical protein
LKPVDIPAALLRYAHDPNLGSEPVGRARAVQEMERHRRKPDEAEALANDLMINVTGFFRDPQAWESFREAVVRPLVEQGGMDGTIRAWVCARASGEEPYSLAMLIAEEVERVGADIEVRIFATDTADKSLSFARGGVFPGGVEGDLSPEPLEKFFDKDEHTYRVKKKYRDQVVFAPQDLSQSAHLPRARGTAPRVGFAAFRPARRRLFVSGQYRVAGRGGLLVRSDQQTMADLPVTAFARSEDRDQAPAAGFDAYLEKPIDPDKLVELILQFR